jgi:hypothetical protein
MSRSPQRSTGSQSETNPDNGVSDRTGGAAAPVRKEKRAKVSLGWRLAAIVWMAGFVAIFGVELANLLWRLLRSVFG